MTDNQLVVFVDDKGLCPAEFLNTVCNLLNLFRGVFLGVLWVGLNRLDCVGFDIHFILLAVPLDALPWFFFAFNVIIFAGAFL